MCLPHLSLEQHGNLVVRHRVRSPEHDQEVWLCTLVLDPENVVARCQGTVKITGASADSGSSAHRIHSPGPRSSIT